MKGTKTITVALILGALAVVALFGTGLVFAAEDDGFPPIVQKLAERFGLDAGEVNDVFVGEHEARRDSMMDRQKERLDKAVEDGKLTEAQKKELIEKLDEMHQNKSDLKGSGPQAHFEAMGEAKEDLRTWAEENDIELSEVLDCGQRGGRMMKHRGGFKGYGHTTPPDGETNTNTSYLTL